ncbi:MAG: 50S ribosomal protein L1, partial [Endomicrobiia bacterium]
PVVIEEVKKGRIEFRNDDYGIVHCGIGKISFDTEKLIENVKTLLDTVIKAKPAQSKGEYLRSIFITTTMGPSIRLDPNEFLKKK